MSEPEQVQPPATAPEPLPPDLAALVGELALEGSVREGAPELVTTPEQLRALLTRVSRELEAPYASLLDLCGVDWGDRLEVVYRLYRPYTAEGLVVRVSVPREGGELPTATGLWGLADWAERECAEMFGIIFTGHPDPRPLLLPDEFAGYPLRKDFVIDRSNPYLSPDPMREEGLTPAAP